MSDPTGVVCREDVIQFYRLRDTFLLFHSSRVSFPLLALLSAAAVCLLVLCSVLTSYECVCPCLHVLVYVLR